MYTDINKLLEDMRGLQDQLEQFFEEAREKFRYTLEDGRVRFSREVQQLQRRYRVSSFRTVSGIGPLRTLLDELALFCVNGIDTANGRR